MIVTAIIIFLALQSLTRRTEMYVAPRDVHATYTIVTEHPEFPCTADLDKHVFEYPVFKIRMPSSHIDGVIKQATICEGGVWHPLPVQTQ